MAIKKPRHIFSADLATVEQRLRELEGIERQSALEKGMLLKHVRDNDLTRGQWGTWLNGFGIDPSTATRYIQVYDQFGNHATSHDLPTSKLFELVKLPERVDRAEFLSQNDVSRMTVKDLRAAVKAEREAVGENKHVGASVPDDDSVEWVLPLFDKRYEQFYDLMTELVETDSEEMCNFLNMEGWFKIDFHSVLGRLVNLPDSLLIQLETGEFTLAQAQSLPQRWGIRQKEALAAMPADFRDKHFDLALHYAEYAEDAEVAIRTVSFIDQVMRAGAEGFQHMTAREIERRLEIPRMFERDFRYASIRARQMEVIVHYTRLWDRPGTEIKPLFI